MKPSLQDSIPWSYCFGCGPANPKGLHVRSYADDGPDGQGQYLCHFTPEEHHAAGPRHFVNGGIIATIIDCHCVFSAVADAAVRQGVPLDFEEGKAPPLWYATASLEVQYLRPTPMGEKCELRASVVSTDERSSRVECSLFADGKECARGTVVAVRVPPEWVAGG